jgi:hypothetical protein
MEQQHVLAALGRLGYGGEASGCIARLPQRCRRQVGPLFAWRADDGDSNSAQGCASGAGLRGIMLGRSQLSKRQL